MIFSASGREDVDVRMLGTGRPFVVELVNARVGRPKEDALAALADRINANAAGLVTVRALQIVHRTELTALRDGEDNKQKSYRCVFIQHRWCGVMHS